MPSPLRFILLNDLHYLDPACATHFSRIIPSINALRPTFVMLLGDLVEHASLPAFRRVQKLLTQFNCPVHTVPGNHDYHPTLGRTPYDIVFPNSANYVFTYANFQFLALDTCTGTAYQNVRVRLDTLTALRTLLPALNPTLPTVLFTHFPLSRAVPYSLRNPATLLALLSKHRLRATFGGHFHGRTLHHYHGIPLHTSPCIARSRQNHDGTTQKGYLLCTATVKSIHTRFIAVNG